MGEKELVGQFLLPLLPERGGDNQQDAASTLGPPLGRSPIRTSIVLPRPTSSARIAPCESGERSAKSAASTLVRIEVHASVRDGSRQALDGSRRTTGERKWSQILGLIGGHFVRRAEGVKDVRSPRRMVIDRSSTRCRRLIK